VCVFVCMCTELLPPGGYPISVKYIISYHITSYLKCLISYRKIVQWKLQRTAKYLEKKLFQCHCLPQIPYEPAWEWTRTSAMTGRWIKANRCRHIGDAYCLHIKKIPSLTNRLSVPRPHGIIVQNTSRLGYEALHQAVFSTSLRGPPARLYPNLPCAVHLPGYILTFPARSTCQAIS